MARFVALPGLPTAAQTANIVLHEVVRQFGPPEDLLSDPCPRGLPMHSNPRKLGPRFIGPFRITRRINPVAYQIAIPRTLRVSPVFHVSHLRKAHSSPLQPPPSRPPSPRRIDRSLAYTVRRLLDIRRRGRGLEYLVDWEGYGPADRSWVPRRDILDPALLLEFHDRNPDLPGPSGAGPRRGGSVMANTHPAHQRAPDQPERPRPGRGNGSVQRRV
uniref:Chromo domain-containing protein n=1 Tax=Denticeps clupeoides TaxID=299321 RepID=A0AAY4AJZ8_9TELE